MIDYKIIKVLVSMSNLVLRAMICLVLINHYSLAANNEGIRCELTYIAKKIYPERNWIRTIERVELKEDKHQDQGKNLEKCKANALDTILKSGWQVISEKEFKQLSKPIL